MMSFILEYPPTPKPNFAPVESVVAQVSGLWVRPCIRLRSLKKHNIDKQQKQKNKLPPVPLSGRPFRSIAPAGRVGLSPRVGAPCGVRHITAGMIYIPSGKPAPGALIVRPAENLKTHKNKQKRQQK